MKKPLLVTLLLLFFVSLMAAHAKAQHKAELANLQPPLPVEIVLAGTTTPTVCIGATINLIAGDYPPFSWSGPNDFKSEERNPSFIATTTAMGGIYTVVISFLGRPRTVTVSVQVRPEVTLTASSNKPCLGGTLQLSANVSGAGLSYSWSGPNDFASTEQNPRIPNFTRDNAGDYSIKVSASNSCSNSAYVFAFPNIPEAEIKVPEPTCTKNGSITLSISPNTPDWQVSFSRSFGGTDFGVGGTKPVPYTPFGSSGTLSIPKGGRPTTLFFINFIFKNSNGCPNIQRTLGPGVLDPITGCCPSVEIYGPSATLCQGTPFTLMSEIYPFGSAYAWSGPNGFSSTAQEVNPIATNSGLYSLSVTAGSCTVTSSISVQTHPSITITPRFAPICSLGNPLSLSASGGVSYLWKGPNGFSSTNASPPSKKSKAADLGIYSVTVPNAIGCTASATVEVYVGAGPIRASSNSPVCKGSPINLSASATYGGVSYKWTKLGSASVWLGATPSIPNAKTTNAGLYTVWVTGENGCISKEEVLVNVINCPGTRLASEEAEEIDMQINAYPNPTSKLLTIEVTLKEPSKLSLKLVNIIGKESGTWQLNEEATVHKTELNLSDLQGGVYLLQAQAGKQKVVKRVVKIQY